MSIMAEPAPIGVLTPINVSALAFALANMHPDLLTPARPGEPWADVIARREAARDILDHLLIDAGCAGHCCLCGGDGQLGMSACPVCQGTGMCGCCR